jgi:hypothetical protein
MILKHVQINFVMTNVLLVFFQKVHQGFFRFNLWHHTLNQHIHIDTMYPSGITHFNTMILIPLCENCKLCTYWYHLVWVFIFLLQYPYYHGIQISKKIKYPYQMGMLKIQYQSNTGKEPILNAENQHVTLHSKFEWRKVQNMPGLLRKLVLTKHFCTVCWGWWKGQQ